MTKKHDEIAERAKYLVENFSNKNGTGSVYTVCPEKKCYWPECQCVTYEPLKDTSTHTAP